LFNLFYRFKVVLIKVRQHATTTLDTSGQNSAAYELRGPGFVVTLEANLLGIPL